MSNMIDMEHSSGPHPSLHIALQVLLNSELLGLILAYADLPSSVRLLCSSREIFQAVVPHVWRRVPYKAILYFQRAAKSKPHLSISSPKSPQDQDRKRQYLHAVSTITVDPKEACDPFIDLPSMSLGELALLPRSFRRDTLSSDWTVLRYLCPNLRRISGRWSNQGPARPPDYIPTRRADDKVIIERLGHVFKAGHNTISTQRYDARTGKEPGFVDQNRYILYLYGDKQDWRAHIQDVAERTEPHGQLCGLNLSWEDVRMAADVVAAYHASAATPLIDVRIAVLMCTLESFRHFIQALGRQVRHLELHIVGRVGDGETMTAYDLPAIAETLRTHCPVLERLALAMPYFDVRRRPDAPPFTPLPWSEVAVPAMGLQDLELELTGPGLMDHESMGSLAAIASSLACLVGRQCELYIKRSDGRKYLRKREYGQSKDIKALVEIFQRMDPASIRRLSGYDFDSLGIACPSDITSLTYDDEGQPIPLDVQRALDELAELDRALVRVDQERAEILAKHQEADTKLRQCLTRGVKRLQGDTWGSRA